MDPHKFDGMIRRLSGSLSRRSLVGGSLGASVLAAVGLSDDEALAKRKRVGAEACIPTGKKCPAKKPRGKKKKKLGCDQCCQDEVVTVTNRKGKQVTKCSCKPLDSVCAPDKSHQCCSGICNNGTCSAIGPCGPSQTLCGGRCVNLQTDDENCGECRRDCPPGEVCNNGLACQGAQCLPVTETEFCVTLAPDGGLTISSGPQCSSDPAEAYGAFLFGLPAGTLFSEVTSVQWSYEFAVGQCGAGSPRIVFVIGGEFLGAQIPPSQCPDQEGTTGELVGNNEELVWAGQTDPAVSNYAEALVKYGAMTIDFVFMVADEPAGQTVTVKPCITVAANG